MPLLLGIVAGGIGWPRGAGGVDGPAAEAVRGLRGRAGAAAEQRGRAGCASPGLPRPHALGWAKE